MVAWGADDPARVRAAGAREGFSLSEVMVAFLILEVGLLGAAGILHLAAHELVVARRVEAAQWDVAALADSLVAGLAGESGTREEPWGVLRWTPDGPGVLVEAVRSEAPDAEPLARVWIARTPAGEGGGG
jgi:hypothetical protein